MHHCSPSGNISDTAHLSEYSTVPFDSLPAAQVYCQEELLSPANLSIYLFDPIFDAQLAIGLSGISSGQWRCPNRQRCLPFHGPERTVSRITLYNIQRAQSSGYRAVQHRVELRRRISPALTDD